MIFATREIASRALRMLPACAFHPAPPGIHIAQVHRPARGSKDKRSRFKHLVGRPRRAGRDFFYKFFPIYRTFGGRFVAGGFNETSKSALVTACSSIQNPSTVTLCARRSFPLLPGLAPHRKKFYRQSKPCRQDSALRRWHGIPPITEQLRAGIERSGAWAYFGTFEGLLKAPRRN